MEPPSLLGGLSSFYNWDASIFPRKWILWPATSYPLPMWPDTTLHRYSLSTIFRCWRQYCLGFPWPGGQHSSSGWHLEPFLVWIREVAFNLACILASPGDFYKVLMPTSTSINSYLIFLLCASMVIQGSNLPLCWRTSCSFISCWRPPPDTMPSPVWRHYFCWSPYLVCSPFFCPPVLSQLHWQCPRR